MTFLSRTKPRTILLGLNIRILIRCSLILVAVGLSAGIGVAQNLPRPMYYLNPSTPPAPVPSIVVLPKPADVRANPSPNHLTKQSPYATPAPSAQPTPPVRVPQVPPQLPAVQNTMFQNQQNGDRPANSGIDFNLRLDPPEPDILFRLESEEQLRQRLRQEGRSKTPAESVDFPELPTLSTEEFTGRRNPSIVAYREPSYVCYKKLIFEEKNSERYGWDLGFIQPAVSSAFFFKDTFLAPMRFAASPLCHYECNAGYCQPGDPVPYLLYPPGITKTGALAEAGAILSLALIVFP